MKITNSSQAPKPAATTGAARAGGSNQRASVRGSSATSISTDPAASLNQLESQYLQSDFSAATVSEITSAIAAGRYQVNAGVVADKLLASTAALVRDSGSSS